VADCTHYPRATEGADIDSTHFKRAPLDRPAVLGGAMPFPVQRYDAGSVRGMDPMLQGVLPGLSPR
jgi:hypothetical protein